MAQPDFFERYQQDPDSFTPKDLLFNGLATVKASVEQLPERGPDAVRWLIVGMGFTAAGLHQIRTQPEFSEPEKAQAAMTVLIQPELYKLLVRPRILEADPQLSTTYAASLRNFIQETFRTLSAGHKTQLLERIQEQRDGFNFGLCELGAQMELSRRRRSPKTPLEQVAYLSGLERRTPEHRRMLAAAWARRQTPRVDDETFGQMVSHFAQRDDMETVMMLTRVKLVGLPLEPGKHPVDWLGNIPWYRLD